METVSSEREKELSDPVILMRDDRLLLKKRWRGSNRIAKKKRHGGHEEGEKFLKYQRKI